MKARCPSSRSMRCQRTAVMRLPRREPGGAGQINATRTAAQTMLACRVDPLAKDLRDARERTLLLVRDLDDAQWMGAKLPIVNPILWELGHLAWFQEYWTLRHPHGGASEIVSADALYDSAKVAHDTRWDLPLPDRARTLQYLQSTLDRCLSALDCGPRYFHELALFHEDMHGEAFAYTRQTLGYPPPPLGAGASAAQGALDGDVEVPGARFLLGATQDEPFVFDNEK